ncbi:MAG: guanylate kinase [Bacteroidetes bacterium]|nr:guanylate kinase [Bacteroidota bacterium]
MSIGKLIAISAPSGCGKTTIAKAILAKHPEILFSVSATTRPIRNGEVNGKDYFFLTKLEFENRIKDGGLVEWEEIYGNYYGTLKSEIHKALDNGRSMMFDVDVKGALSIRRNFPKDSVLVFIEPPDMEVLIERLKNRKTENAETLKRRLDRVPMELEQGSQFDFKVVNDDLDAAIAQVDEIVKKIL